MGHLISVFWNIWDRNTEKVWKMQNSIFLDEDISEGISILSFGMRQ